MRYRTPLAQVKGLGASGEGSHHWWIQRLTALALVPLSFWFVFSILNHISDDHASVVAWISQPGVAVMLILYLAFMFIHAQLGVQVVIEDYVHNERVKMVSLLLVKTVLLVVGVGSVFSVLRLAL